MQVGLGFRAPKDKVRSPTFNGSPWQIRAGYPTDNKPYRGAPGARFEIFLTPVKDT